MRENVPAHGRGGSGRAGRAQDPRRARDPLRRAPRPPCTTPARAVTYPRARSMSLMPRRRPSERASRPVRRQHLFHLLGARALLLVAVRESDRLSVVTTAPNASAAPAHDRIPLVLRPGESSVWLEPGFTALADRSSILLASESEH